MTEKKIICDDEPHPDYGGWEKFLANHCEVRDQHEGTVYYGSTNCNYIVLPNGVLLQNYGYHGRALMHRIREEGWEVIHDEYQEYKKNLRALLQDACPERTAVLKKLADK